MKDVAGFALHPRLAADCAVVGEMPVSRLLLMNDRRFPWCVLVPRIGGLSELHELPAGRRPAFIEEVASVSRLLLESCGAHKINIGALGNVVPQLHVHVVARSSDDDAWPAPVWGHGQAEPYAEEALLELTERLRRGLSL